MFRSRFWFSKLVFISASITALSGAKAEEVLLSCWGTVDVIQESKHTNPADERYSIVIAVDVAKKTLKANGVNWSIFGDVTGETVVAMDPEKGSVSLNRITGAVTAHFIEINRLKNFYGECKPAQKLF